jgi:hypothetical protein
MATLADLERTIQALPDDAFRVFTSSKNPPTETELADLEQKLGKKLPNGLREVLLRYGVLVVEVIDEVWPRMKEFDVGPAWRFQYAVRVLGAGPAVPPPLRLEDAMTKALADADAVPYFQRVGARWVGAFTSEAVGTFAEDEGFEEANGDAVDLVLREIAALEEGVARLRVSTASIEELMKTGRDAKWEGPKASDVVDALKKQNAAAIAPHLKELCDVLLPPGHLSMGCLDIVEAAGAEAFPSVAEQIYAHMGEGDDPYVIALLAHLKISAPRAMTILRDALASDDEDTVEAALDALGAVDRSAATEAIPAIEARIDTFEGDALAAAIGLLGKLGAKRFEALASNAIDEADDDTFTSLLRALEGVDLAKSTLTAKITARYATLAPDERATLEAIEAFVDLGLDDPKTMRPIVEKHWKTRGGLWEKRADALIERWK